MFHTTTTRLKNQSARRRVGAALSTVALVALMTAAIGTMSASADRKHHGATSNKLVGSWMVTVNRGPALPALKSLQTYTRGRGVIENSNGGPTARSASHGAWQRIGARTYRSTQVFFRYDPDTRAYLGTVKLRHELQLSPDGQSFTGVAVGELRDPAGNLLPGSNARRDNVSGTRINAEPLPG